MAPLPRSQRQSWPPTPRPCLICTSDTGALCKAVVCTEAQGMGGEGGPSLVILRPCQHLYWQGPAGTHQPQPLLLLCGPMDGRMDALEAAASQFPTCPSSGSEFSGLLEIAWPLSCLPSSSCSGSVSTQALPLHFSKAALKSAPGPPAEHRHP